MEMHHIISINGKREQQQQSCLFKLYFPLIGRVTILLPVFGFLYSIIWSFLFHFEKTTYTHCKVSNYLPSISAAFNYPSMSYIWRISIAFHAAPRLLIMFIYYHYNKRKKMKQTSPLSRYQGHLARFAAFTNTIENICLVLLTNISSNENKALHVMSFTGFVLFSVPYILTTCFMHSAMTVESSTERKSLNRKWRSCVINFSSLFFAMYFYHRHNNYCEPGVYTLFAISEYIFVFSNMAFHYTAVYDFENYVFGFEEDTKIYP